MVSEKPTYAQVTPEQIQLWESHPVTKVYLQCLQWKHEQVREIASGGDIVDSSNADLTHAKIHENLGQQQGLETSVDYLTLFNGYGMVLEAKDESK